MKIKGLLISMLACTALVGCTSDDVIDNVTQEDNVTNQYAIKINLNFPGIDASSRAFDPSKATFEDGISQEYYVNNCVVRFYDGTKKYLGSKTIAEKDFSSVTNETPNGNITKAAEVTFRSVSKPVYAIAVVNDRTSSGTIGNITENTIDDLKSMVVYDQANTTGSTSANLIYTLDETASISNSGNFLMTNSTYKNGNEIIQEVDITGAVKEVEKNMTNDEAFALITNPADIYVERVVAKVGLNMTLDETKNPEIKIEGKTGVYQLRYQTVGEETGDLAPYAIHVLGWGLNATNKSFYPLKNISGINWDSSWNGTGRTFWAVDKNYNQGKYLEKDLLKGTTAEDGTTTPFKYNSTEYDLNYRTLDQITNAINSNEYCYENTIPANVPYYAVTHAVIKVRYMEQGEDDSWNYVPEGQYVYRINQVLWNEANFRKHVAASLIDKYIYKNGETQMSQNDLSSKLSFTVDHVDAIVTIGVSTDVTVLEKDGTTLVTDINWNTTANVGTVVAYKDGFCYYTIPIKHFDVAKDNVGHYGVVRNHWYQLGVTSIAGFGEPGTGQPIIPEEETLKDWAVKCRINILAWSKVAQDNIEVGNGNTWN